MFNKQHGLAAWLLDYSTARCRAQAALEKSSATLGVVISQGAYLVRKWAQVGRLEFAFWTLQLFFASWILKPAVSVLLISFDFPSARLLAWDSFLISSNFWWNYSIFLRQVVHFNFCR